LAFKGGDVLHEGLHFLRLTHVALDISRSSARRLIAHGFLTCSPVAVRSHQPGTGLGEWLHDGSSDTLRAACHKYHCAVEVCLQMSHKRPLLLANPVSLHAQLACS